MSKRTNRELCMLAQVYNRARSRVAGMYLSEKLDGMRCLWIPETKGKSTAEIPFANRDKKKRDFVASGLWSRYGNVIHCPPGFTENWPDYALDGELYIGRKTFQLLMDTVKEQTPDPTQWGKVKYNVFDRPCYHALFQDGRINNPQYIKTIKSEDNFKALSLIQPPRKNNFDFTYRLLEKDWKEILTPTLVLHPQRLLPFNTPMAMEILDKTLEEVTSNEGEGLILRHPASQWEPIRSEYLLKVKKLQDAEAKVVGYRYGQGKYLGMLGSLRVDMGGTVFELSGFTDDERGLFSSDADYARSHPGDVWVDDGERDGPSPRFPIGSVVTFRYRELSDDGIPKEARFLRIHQ